MSKTSRATSSSCHKADLGTFEEDVDDDDNDEDADDVDYFDENDDDNDDVDDKDNSDDDDVMRRRRRKRRIQPQYRSQDLEDSRRMCHQERGWELALSI